MNKFNILSFGFADRAFADITSTFFSIRLETIFTHHDMPAAGINHTRFVIITELALLLIVLLLICVVFSLRFSLLNIGLVI